MVIVQFMFLHMALYKAYLSKSFNLCNALKFDTFSCFDIIIYNYNKKLNCVQSETNHTLTKIQPHTMTHTHKDTHTHTKTHTKTHTYTKAHTKTHTKTNT